MPLKIFVSEFKLNISINKFLGKTKFKFVQAKVTKVAGAGAVGLTQVIGFGTVIEPW